MKRNYWWDFWLYAFAILIGYCNLNILFRVKIEAMQVKEKWNKVSFYLCLSLLHQDTFKKWTSRFTFSFNGGDINLRFFPVKGRSKVMSSFLKRWLKFLIKEMIFEWTSWRHEKTINSQKYLNITFSRSPV